MQLILVRHPPALGAHGRCYGRLDLPPQPDALLACAAMLRQYRGLPVFSSPLRRCRLLAQRLHPRPQLWPLLQELDFGAWEGRPWDELPREQLDAWAADIWHYRPGGGESAAMLRARWQQVVARLQATGLPRVLLVTHAGLIRLALAEHGLLDEDSRWSAPIGFASPYLLEI